MITITYTEIIYEKITRNKKKLAIMCEYIHINII